MLKAIEKYIVDQQGRLPTKTDEPIEYLYHVSPTAGIKVLKPSTNKNSEKHGSKKTNRVCLGDGVYCCVQALFLPGWGRKFNYSKDDVMIHLNEARISLRTFQFHVYRAPVTRLNPDKVIVYEVGKKNEYYPVFDQLLTGEVGYTDPLPVEYVGSVDVTMLSQAEHLASQKYPYMYYGIFITDVKDGQNPAHFHDFTIKISGPGKEYSLNEIDLEKHKETLNRRGQLMREHLRRVSAEIARKLDTYYVTGNPVE